MASNRQVSGDDPTAHAEIELLRVAARSGYRPPLRGLHGRRQRRALLDVRLGDREGGVGALVYGAPHEPHMDPDLGVADVFARARNPPRVTAGILADRVRRPDRRCPRAYRRAGLELPPTDAMRGALLSGPSIQVSAW